MRNRVVLNADNVFSHAAIFQKDRSKHPVGTCFLNILIEMHNSGKYIPNAKWLILHAGQGMVNARLEPAWRMYLQPAEVSRDDVIKVYFSTAGTLKR